MPDKVWALLLLSIKIDTFCIKMDQKMVQKLFRPRFQRGSMHSFRENSQKY